MALGDTYLADTDGETLLTDDGSEAIDSDCCCGTDCCCATSNYDIDISLDVDETDPGAGPGWCPDPVGDHTASGTLSGGPSGSDGCYYSGTATGGDWTWYICLRCRDDYWSMDASYGGPVCEAYECGFFADTYGDLTVTCSGGDVSSVAVSTDMGDGDTGIGTVTLSGSPA
jgi:hypothetical protein